MILPVRAFGDSVLRKKCHAIDAHYPELKELILSMYETMYGANGIGLAAPQIGLDIRLFCVDVSPLAEDEDYADISEELKSFKKVFINAQIIEESGETETYSDIRARVIQHEYDHIEGILFTDHLSPLKKKMVKGKLNKISQGEVGVSYKMRFPK